MSAIVGGRAITDDDVLEKMKDHQLLHPPAKKKIQDPSSTLSTAKPSTSRIIPSSSGIAVKRLRRSPEKETRDSDSEIVDDDDEVCCQCQLFQPVEVRNCTSLIFVKWAECTHPTCKHWVHLQFCTPVKTVPRHSEFWCPCHDEKEE